ncbi:MAG TPA: type II secretion system F family protein [Burkholderiales bacterium]|nr:type II secretion system F family protein [Burkholderiales bacterium]
MDFLYYGFILLIFVAAVLALEGVYLVWNSSRGPEARRIERRLRAMSAGSHVGSEVALIKDRVLSNLPALHQTLMRIPRAQQFDRFLIQAGSTLTVSRFIGVSAGLAFLGFALPLLLRLPFLFSLTGAVIGGSLPFIRLTWAKNRRMRKLEEQLPEALDLMSRALRAGHAFPSALQMAGTEIAEPMAGEFRIVFEEINFGISVKDALMNLATRIPSADLRYFVIAVIIQRETGGNLAELLDNIAALIRARFKLMGQIRVLATEGRLSAWVLTLLPIGTGLVINLLNPEFMSVLWSDPAGLKMVGFAGFMMVFGIFWMWRIVKIRV